MEKSILTAVHKSAEGIVGVKQARLVRHSKAERRRTDMLSRKADTEGLNGSLRRGLNDRIAGRQALLQVLQQGWPILITNRCATL